MPKKTIRTVIILPEKETGPNPHQKPRIGSSGTRFALPTKICSSSYLSIYASTVVITVKASLSFFLIAYRFFVARLAKGKRDCSSFSIKAPRA